MLSESAEGKTQAGGQSYVSRNSTDHARNSAFVFMQLTYWCTCSNSYPGMKGVRELSHFPQKCQRFRANGLLAISYVKSADAKFCHIRTVQKIYTDIVVVLRVLPCSSGASSERHFVPADHAPFCEEVLIP